MKAASHHVLSVLVPEPHQKDDVATREYRFGGAVHPVRVGRGRGGDLLCLGDNFFVRATPLRVGPLLSASDYGDTGIDTLVRHHHPLRLRCRVFRHQARIHGRLGTEENFIKQILHFSKNQALLWRVEGESRKTCEYETLLNCSLLIACCGYVERSFPLANLDEAETRRRNELIWRNARTSVSRKRLVEWLPCSSVPCVNRTQNDI